MESIFEGASLANVDFIDAKFINTIFVGCDLSTVKNFDINDYLIVNQISELDLSASAKTVGGAFAVAAVWAVVSLIAVYGVFKRRDI